MDLDSARLLLKFGLLVDIGIDESPKLGGNFSSRLGRKAGLKLDDGVFENGGALLFEPAPFWEVAIGEGNALGAVSNGAGCNGAGCNGACCNDPPGKLLPLFPNGDGLALDGLVVSEGNPF